MCLVEVDGRKGYPASCTTPIEAGMKIRTQTEALHNCGATLWSSISPIIRSTA